MYKIKKFGNSMHIVLPKSSGFNVGDEVSIETPQNQSFLDPAMIALIHKAMKKLIQAQIDQTIDEARRGQY
jgi:antitoxin component of MazEF toxin-antitoxin module